MRNAPACTDGQRDQLSIASDLTGTGTLLYKCAHTGEAIMCAVRLHASESYERDGRWELEGDVGYCAAAGADLGRLFEECEPISDDEYYCCDPSGRSCFDIVRA